MPIKSAKQYGLMQKAANNNRRKNGKSIGPSPSVARKFISETPSGMRKQFAQALSRQR